MRGSVHPRGASGWTRLRDAEQTRIKSPHLSPPAIVDDFASIEQKIGDLLVGRPTYTKSGRAGWSTTIRRPLSMPSRNDSCSQAQWHDTWIHVSFLLQRTDWPWSATGRTAAIRAMVACRAAIEHVDRTISLVGLCLLTAVQLATPGLRAH